MNAIFHSLKQNTLLLNSHIPVTLILFLFFPSKAIFQNCHRKLRFHFFAFSTYTTLAPTSVLSPLWSVATITSYYQIQWPILGLFSFKTYSETVFPYENQIRTDSADVDHFMIAESSRSLSIILHSHVWLLPHWASLLCLLWRILLF